MLWVCQSGLLRDRIGRGALLFVRHIAVGADGTFARDAPGMAQLKAMKTRDRPLPELISLPAQHVHARRSMPLGNAYAVA
jgi:hypothetical protein